MMTDTLKPVNCGCGGEAVIQAIWQTVKDRYVYQVGCLECFTQTITFKTEAEAITAWNRAMSAGKDEIAITKGYWMATYDGLHCSVCNYKCETTALPEVCPHCGTRLIRW